MQQVINDFEAHKAQMDQKEREGDVSYSIEFMKLRALSQNLKMDKKYSTHEGEKPENTSKNRYTDILPFDYCRVKLLSGGVGDYINASFINSPTQQRYITAQGPLPSTLEHFWTMLWQQGVSTIVMACMEKEGFPPKAKCQRYWSSENGEDLTVGNFTIKMLEEFEVPGSNGDITRRSLLVRCGDETRKMTHLHHTEWPDKLIPTCVSSILHLISTMRACHSEDQASPLLVHCSAGCGRTGSIITIDYIRTLLNKKTIPKDFSVFGIISQMRRQRTSIVQTQEQYHCVHMAVSSMFQSHLQTLPNAPTRHTESEYVTSIPVLGNQPLPHSSKILQGCKVASPYATVCVLRRSMEGDSVSHSAAQSKEMSSACISINKHKCRVEASKVLRSNTAPCRMQEVTTGVMFRGYDIGYPNRVGKPHGPRCIPVTFN